MEKFKKSIHSRSRDPYARRTFASGGTSGQLALMSLLPCISAGIVIRKKILLHVVADHWNHPVTKLPRLWCAMVAMVLSNVIASQVDVHALYGGVVPELASRKHMEAVAVVIDDALRKANVALADIEGIAVTRGPGLVGALLVGLSMAKAMALSLGIPLVGVHHMEGHILAPLLEQDIAFPYLALAVSGWSYASLPG